MNPKSLRVFDLEQPRHHRMPIHPAHVPPGFSFLLHRRHQPGGAERRTGASGVLVGSEHSGTHVDALCHQAEEMRLFGGVEAGGCQTPFGFTKLGVETMGPIVSTGWLIDLGVVEPGGWVPLARVQQAAREQAVEPAPGDVVLVRTGNGIHWEEPERYLNGSGMESAVSNWLAGLGVRAVGADNVAWDWPGGPDPELGVTLPGHLILLVRSGVHILENLFLEELAAAGVHRFTFVCLPLKLVGATGSPVRPVALVEP